MQKAEISSFARLLVTETAQNLVRVFFLRENLKSLADGKWNGSAFTSSAPAPWAATSRPGARGTVLSSVSATPSRSRSPAPSSAPPISTARSAATTAADIRDALDRLIPDLKGEGVASADLIIEAVPEVLELKRKIFAGIEPKMKPDAILATNTSSIPLEQLREGLPRPERLVGIHFFNPVSRMQLVEVVSHDQVAARRARRCPRLPRPHRPAAGAGQERAGLPGQPRADAVSARSSGHARFRHAAKRASTRRPMDFGMPMGPIELADEVGLDICLHVAEMLRDSLNREMPEPPQWLQDKVAQGRARQENRQRPLCLEGRPCGEGP